MSAAESNAADIRAAFLAAIEALGDVMLEMQRRELLARTGPGTRAREMLSSKSMTDEQIGDLAARAFKSGARVLAKAGLSGDAAGGFNLRDQPGRRVSWRVELRDILVNCSRLLLKICLSARNVVL